MKPVFKKKSKDIKMNTDGIVEEQKKPSHSKAQLKQWHHLISDVSSVREHPHWTLLQI
jgi:hypothetical protein